MYRKTLDRIKEVLQAVSGEEDVGLVEGGEHADLASTIAFSLAKKYRRPPVQIAPEIADKIAGDLAAEGIETQVV
ncbi:MAG TPA: arginine--tRNA ligase, partial [Methanomicrobiales archaeon]|nr:arginine--tRNA ligase [Methanomicrobiales archaeon]